MLTGVFPLFECWGKNWVLVRYQVLKRVLELGPIFEFQVPIKGWGSNSNFEVGPWIKFKNLSLVLLWKSSLTSGVEVRVGSYLEFILSLDSKSLVEVSMLNKKSCVGVGPNLEVRSLFTKSRVWILNKFWGQVSG